ncbi:hypothetical protein GF359_07810, partial [candidate division WOR-3 bacterium]|nr:hypothetical protein [candidate division WOR-3 bacterium]MBD3365106.1 hypothetical protein [candidate division WOR-3 bacterium]
MLHSELLVNACHSLSGGLLFGFPVLAILVTVLYLFKTQDTLRRERLIIKGLRELVANKDTDRHLPSTKVIDLAEKRFAELKAQSSIDPKLLLALDYNLN